MNAPRPVSPMVPAGCSTKAVGSNHCSGVPRTALSVVRPGARLGRSRPCPGPSDGDQRERERLAWTNTVSGGPLRIRPIPASCQSAKSARARPLDLAGERQVPGEVDDPVVLRVVVGETPVVVGVGELGHPGHVAVGRVGEEGRGLGGVDVARERVGGLEAEAAHRDPAQLHDQGVVPGLPVAALELDRGEAGVRPRGGGRVEGGAVGERLGDRHVHVAVAQQVPAPRAGVAHGQDHPPRQLLLHVQVPDVEPRGLRCPTGWGEWTGRRASRSRASGSPGRGITGRGVNGGLVTVTMRFCWLLLLK